MSKSFFITGTDTDAGKTEITLALMRAIQSRGNIVSGYKPIACGGTKVSALLQNPKLENPELQNEDARRIMSQISSEFWDKAHINAQNRYSSVNPVLFEPPIAPHIAAAKANAEINITDLIEGFKNISTVADYTFVEGVGGWQVPLGNKKTTVDLVKALEVPVILVVGLKLGALNHALLTYQNIINSGVECVGWVATVVDPEMTYVEENIESLKQYLACPCLGVVPNIEVMSTDKLIQYLEFDQVGRLL